MEQLILGIIAFLLLGIFFRLSELVEIRSKQSNEVSLALTGLKDVMLEVYEKINDEDRIS